MPNCASCFSSVDGRSAKSCLNCNKPLHEECSIKFGGELFCDVCFTVKDERKNQIDFELPEFVRRSHIETYRACPQKFYQEVIKGHEMPDNEYLRVGSDVHEIIEEGIENNISYEEALALNDNYFAGYEDSLFQNKTRAEMYERATESLNTFYHMVRQTLDPTFAIEETIFTDLGNNIPKMRITMDLITEKDGELEMHDWKTGRVMVGKKLSSDLQAPLYIYSVIHHYGRPVRQFTFYYLQENKTRTFVRSATDPDTYICTVGKREYKISLLDAVREVKTLFSKIKKGHFGGVVNGPDRFFTQKMCHLDALGLCCKNSNPWDTI